MGIADGDKNGGSVLNLEIQKLMNQLNRPAVKSIKSPDGDIIDCVHILNQPAFQNSKLRDHKIQMKPSFHPEGMMFEENEASSSRQNPISQLWHQSGSCPEGTIPIRRIREEDILRAESIQRFGKKNHKSIPEFTSFKNEAQHQFATVYVTGDKYYGGKASMNIWKPIVEKHNEFSNSQLGYKMAILVKADSGQSTGCFDMLCSGFVQLNNGVAVGASIQPLSVYGDLKSQFDMTILIWKDPINGDWWMQYGRDTVVGYWPSSLFGRLSDGATTILWGGEVLNLASEDGKHSTTQMGSGHFAGEAQGRASYFRNITIVNGKNQSVPPPNGVATYSDHVKCCNVKMASSNDELGAYFYFGGPGRNLACL
ncbi:uncharacterized protein LOC114730477 [Neltuma alba]|uniref:uncharacterized protein LOC114730477 n=1 Tax=Neltuma alba TaxID=207710 RepID=UPI0010A3605C|nr:uncharacterized protein LOC114730477 [Prosopis alba]